MKFKMLLCPKCKKNNLWHDSDRWAWYCLSCGHEWAARRAEGS